MTVEHVMDTLHEFLVRWFSDEDFRDDYEGDVSEALKHHGYGDVDADMLLQCLPLVAEDLSVDYQKSVYEYLSTIDVENTSDARSGSDFDVTQGGGAGSGGWHGKPSDADAVAKHIYEIENITENNWSYIDDRDVTTSVNALGDVDFDQVVASGDGAVVAGDDAYGVNTGTNNGVIAGGDAYGNDVNNVTGDGNTTVGDMSSGAIVASGDDNVFAEDSNVLTGKFSGQFIGGDVDDSNVIGGDSGIAAASGAGVWADDVNVGGNQTNVDAQDSAVNFGDGDNTNDQSTNLDVDVDDSFNTDASTNDSYNSDDDVKIRDAFKADASTNDSYNSDDDVKVEDSFTVEDSFDHEYELEVDVEESFNEDNSVNTAIKTEIETEIEESFNEAEDGHRGGGHDGGGHDGGWEHAS